MVIEGPESGSRGGAGGGGGTGAGGETPGEGGGDVGPGDGGAAEGDEGIRWDKAPCRFCGTGCSVLVGVKDGMVVASQGDPDAPVANPDMAETDEDTPIDFIPVLANDTDPENDPLDVTTVTQGSDGSVVINPDNTVTYTPNADTNGLDSFTYTITDVDLQTSTATVSSLVT